MKKSLLIVASVLVMGVSASRATFFTYSYTSGFANSGVVPDANPTGWADSRTISGIPVSGGDGTTAEITDVNVRLNLSSGYNGDLYGYLQLHDSDNNTVLTVLLNRVGQGTGSEPVTSFGYGDAGLNITLDASGAFGNIHNYQTNAAYATKISDGSSFLPDSGAGSLASFNGLKANGTWTLFLADMSGGSVSSVTSWGLDINVVPEPVTWAMITFGALVGSIQIVRWQQRRPAVS